MSNRDDKMYGQTKLSVTVPSLTLRVKRFAAARYRISSGLYTLYMSNTILREKLASALKKRDLEYYESSALWRINHYARANSCSNTNV